MSSLSNSGRKLISLDDMFGGSADSIDETEEKKKEPSMPLTLPIETLHPKKNHKFQINLGKKNDDLLQSIKEFGVLEPVIVRPLQNKEYEILAGHRRTAMAREAGFTEIPVVIKIGLSEAEADLIETETNLLQRSWGDMSHSERAEVLYAHYNALNIKGIRKGFLDEINEEIKSLTNPVNSMADGGLSPLATKGDLRASGEAYELSKDTVSRYLRIYALSTELKERMDVDEIALRAGVHISYISQEHQKVLNEFLDSYKIDIEKAKDLRELESKGKLDENTMQEILAGKKRKKPGRPQGFKIQGNIIQKYFKDVSNKKEIERIIDEALESYFSEH